jgi:opacity protein-like surface antigen
MIMVSAGKRLLMVLVAWVSFVVYADNMQLDGNLLLTGTDAGSNENFKSGQALTIHYNYYFNSWLAADVGLLVTGRTLEESAQDVVGDYRTSIESQALLLGIKPAWRLESPYEIYGRLGLQYWLTELEVEEYFGPGIPEGKSSADDNGYGYYLGVGVTHFVTDKFIVLFELSHYKQLDVFEGESAYPFDLAINAFSFGVGYRF